MGEEGSRQVSPYYSLGVVRLLSVASLLNDFLVRYGRPTGEVYTQTHKHPHIQKREKSPGLAERDLTECVLAKCDLSECDMAEQNSWIC